MRLLFALPAAISATLPGYSSTCDRAAGQLHINIPYENPTTAELLSFVAGSCSGSGASGTNHAYAHDATSETATLSLNIAGCGLNSVLYDTPYLTRNGEYYMATANVTLGVNDNGNHLIFYNAVVGAECGHRTDYTVTFDYHQQIVTADQTGCQTGPNGECVLPAFEIYNFTMSEFTDDSYNTAADASNRQTQANQMIYLQLAATDLPADRKMAIKKCRFVDDAVEYPMFSPYDSICDNRLIDLEWSYQNNANAANIAHRLFLLAAGDQDSYQLICDVKVCDRDDLSSECNAWSHCLESSVQQAYVCDSLTCPANAQSCSVASTTNAAQCSFECNCDNGVSDVSFSCAAQQCTSCNSGYTLVNGACVVTQCTCSNGVGTSGTACASHDTVDCVSCNEYYFLELGACVSVETTINNHLSGSGVPSCTGGSNCIQITMFREKWAGGSAGYVSLWVEDPNGEMIGWQSTTSSTGALRDVYSGLNSNSYSIENTQWYDANGPPSGNFVVNAHAYRLWNNPSSSSYDYNCDTANPCSTVPTIVRIIKDGVTEYHTFQVDPSYDNAYAPPSGSSASMSNAVFQELMQIDYVNPLRSAVLTRSARQQLDSTPMQEDQ